MRILLSFLVFQLAFSFGYDHWLRLPFMALIIKIVLFYTPFAHGPAGSLASMTQ